MPLSSDFLGEINSYKTKTLFLNGEATKFKTVIFKNFKEFRLFLSKNFSLSPFVCYLLRNTKGFASFFTELSFDVVICNYNGLIISIQEEVKPKSFTKPVKNAYLLYLFPVGSVKYLDLILAEIITPYSVILER